MQNEEKEHNYAIRSLYGTLGDKGFPKDEIKTILHNLALEKGQWTISRLTTKELKELHLFINSNINFKDYLK